MLSKLAMEIQNQSDHSSGQAIVDYLASLTNTFRLTAPVAVLTHNGHTTSKALMALVSTNQDRESSTSDDPEGTSFVCRTVYRHCGSKLGYVAAEHH
jgi:hypothetical protein